MRISKVKVYDYEESLLASGYPMKAVIEDRDLTEGDAKRGLKLTEISRTNGAHAQWLTGVRVSFDLTFSNKAWVEAERYRFLEFVSSQSTMHRISKMDIAASCNKYVDPRVIRVVEEKKGVYLQTGEMEDYLALLYNVPAGFEITARMTTNFRCLLNIYIQRHDHRLPEWREFCKELLEIPHFKEYVDAYNKSIEE